jgi:DNA modification methylase
MSTFQPILYYGKDWRAGKGALPSGRQVTESAEKNGHPCPKPVGAWKWLVDKTAPAMGTVLDPFMGSGTTGVACANLGRSFIGIELERKYFDIACERIEAAHAQGRLFQ